MLGSIRFSVANTALKDGSAILVLRAVIAQIHKESVTETTWWTILFVRSDVYSHFIH